MFGVMFGSPNEVRRAGMAESESVRTARLATGSREPFRLRVELELENKGRSESWREKSKGNRRKDASSPGMETGFSSYLEKV